MLKCTHCQLRWIWGTGSQ